MPGFRAELTGCFSTPCDDNPTVVMLEAGYRHLGLDWRYINAEVEPAGLAAAVAGGRAMGWRGFNLSMPHKVAVIEQLDGLGESARLINAVNCVVNRDGRLTGDRGGTGAGRRGRIDNCQSQPRPGRRGGRPCPGSP
jgi:shikimate dehydrogenase